MGAEPTNFLGRIDGIIYRSEETGYTVLNLETEDDDLVTAVGTLPFLTEGEKLQVSGRYVEHPSYGRQFRIDRFELIRPSNEEELVRYLSSGIIKGVGKSMAKQLVEEFGKDILSVIENTPEKLTKVSGIGPKKAKAIYTSYMENAGQREATIFLQQFGVSSGMIAKICKKYGSDTVTRIKDNPYALADDIDGIGFITADKIGRAMGIEPDSPKRLQSGISYTLLRASTNGNTCLSVNDLLHQTSLLLGCPEEAVSNEFTVLALNEGILSENVDGTDYVWLKSFYRAETSIAKHLNIMCMQPPADRLSRCDAVKKIEGWEKKSGFELAEKQREAVCKVFENQCLIITGGPGTGKTTTLNCLLAVLEECGATVVLAAPTGRAAKRMTQATGREASTLHRLLGFGKSDESREYDTDSVLEADVVVVDEVSMVDTMLMSALVQSLEAGTRLVLVGDSDQLPSVGAGNVLGDLLASGVVQSVRLDRNFRQAEESMIVVNAHRINQGLLPIFRADSDFFFIEAHSAVEVVSTVEDLVIRRLPAYKGFDPMNDIQVLTPIKKTDCGIINLNVRLQQLLNPEAADKAEQKHGAVIFREGDKVMQIKNDYMLTWTNVSTGEEGDGVFNGDIGTITELDSENRTLQITSQDERLTEYDISQFDELLHAYAITVHKSQGSEFPVVVLPIWSGPPMLMTRNLLYTALTRAKKLAVIVGSKRMLAEMIANDHIEVRTTGLGYFIRRAREIATGELM